MTAIVRHEDGKSIHWDASLAGNGPYQWTLRIECIVDEEDNHRIYDVTNRSWRSVGPEFDTQNEGSKYLGFKYGLKEQSVSKNWDQLIDEYNSLFSDEIETHERFGQDKKFGRPSQGRTERLQVAVTPEIKRWIEEQIKQGENISLVTFRILQNLYKEQNKEVGG